MQASLRLSIKEKFRTLLWIIDEQLNAAASADTPRLYYSHLRPEPSVPALRMSIQDRIKSSGDVTLQITPCTPTINVLRDLSRTEHPALLCQRRHPTRRSGHSSDGICTEQQSMQIPSPRPRTRLSAGCALSDCHRRGAMKPRFLRQRDD